jgi:hypothetical protein
MLFKLKSLMSSVWYLSFENKKINFEKYSSKIKRKSRKNSSKIKKEFEKNIKNSSKRKLRSKKIKKSYEK